MSYEKPIHREWNGQQRQQQKITFGQIERERKKKEKETQPIYSQVG